MKHISDFKAETIYGRQGSNIIAKGDNLEFMRCLKKKERDGLQLIYADPPFFSRANYDSVIWLESDKVKAENRKVALKAVSYSDIWKEGIQGYLDMLRPRLVAMRELLSEEGSLWLHLDWHAVHYVKVLMDEIFGEDNFVNEIIWTYKSGGTGRRRFSRKHDTLLFYSKGSNYYFSPLEEKSYNRGLQPYRFKGVDEFEDEKGWYTVVNMKDVWQIDMVGRTSGERTGYATQKPELLLERIIKSCSREGDICADFFGGSATAAATAEKSGRKWIYCDKGDVAVSSAVKRMKETGADFDLLTQEDYCGGKRSISASVELEGRDVVVTGFCLDVAELPLDAKDREKVKDYLEKDPLKLIDYWSIDIKGEESVHRPGYFSARGSDEKWRYTLPDGAKGKIRVQLSDVFGNVIYEYIDV